MQRLRNLAFLAIVAGGLFTALLLHFHSHSRKLLQAGDIFPKVGTRDIGGKYVSWPSQSFIVLYMRHDAEMGLQLESYEYLKLQKHDRMLPMISIVAGTEKEVRDIPHQAGNNANIILPDNGGWRTRLGLDESPLRLFLVDGTSQIKFATDYATPDDLRQLTEKALTGHIEYPASQPRLLQKGDRFTGFPVVDMRSNGEVVFTAQAATSILCFTSHCPACDLEEEIRNYAIEIHNSEHVPATLLFSNRFSRVDLLRMLDRYGIQSQVLQATQNIPGLEDPLSFETYAPAEIAQIDLDAGGVVKRIAYWTNGTKKSGGL